MASEWHDAKPFIMNPYRDAENHGWEEWDEADLLGRADARLCRALDGTFGPCEPAMYVRAARAWQAFRDWLNGVGERGDMSMWQAHSMAALERGYAMREHKR